MKVFGADDKELMAISSIARQGDELVVKGRIFGAMPLTAKLRPEEVRSALKLLDIRTILFILTMAFRSGKAAKP